MSLEFIFNHSNLKELKPKLLQTFPTPKLILNSELKSPPLTVNYSTVGQAFDYLLRFYIEIKNPNKLYNNEWVASNAFNRLLMNLIKMQPSIVRAGRKFDKSYNRIELIGFISQEYYRARLNYKVAIEKKRLTNEIIASSLFLARLDVFLRTGIIDPNFMNNKDEDLIDLKSLLKNLNWRSVKVQNHCILNPTYGKGSSFILGADSDLIIDDTLIDIKVTQELKLKRSYLNQLIIYYTLYLIGGVDNFPGKVKINYLAVYFARHSVMVKIPIKDLGTLQTFQEFKKWFVNYIDKNVYGKK